MADQQRVFRCHQGGFLARAVPVEGVVIHDVYCRKCDRRHDLYLGERDDRQACPGEDSAPESPAPLAMPGVRAVG